jgi:hypothetical protein
MAVISGQRLLRKGTVSGEPTGVVRLMRASGECGMSLAMDKAEPFDLVTVLSRLEDLRGKAHEIGRHSADDLHLAPAADAERTGLFRKMLRRFWADGSAPRKS